MERVCLALQRSWGERERCRGCCCSQGSERTPR